MVNKEIKSLDAVTEDDAEGRRGEDIVVEVDLLRWKDSVIFLKKKHKLDLFIDLCVVDYPDRKDRYKVVVHLRSLEGNKRARLKVRCSGDEPTITSICDIYPAANWFEREAFDLFGVKFEGHPNLKRILCHDDFIGHPLRKDFDKRRRFNLSAPADLLEEM